MTPPFALKACRLRSGQWGNGNRLRLPAELRAPRRIGYPLRRHDGEVTALLITIYPIMRILEERIRTDEGQIGRTGMTISQNVSILLLAAAITLWIFVLRGPKLKYASA